MHCEPNCVCPPDKEVEYIVKKLCLRQKSLKITEFNHKDLVRK